MRKATELVFYRKYSQQSLYFVIGNRPQAPFTLRKPYGIRFDGNLENLKILHCFGHTIKCVSFYFRGSIGDDHCKIEQRILNQLNTVLIL